MAQYPVTEVTLLIPVGGQEFAWHLGIANNQCRAVYEPGRVQYFGYRKPFFREDKSYTFRIEVTPELFRVLRGDKEIYAVLRKDVGARSYPDFPDASLCFQSCNAVTLKQLRLSVK